MNKYLIGGLIVLLGLAAAFMATQKKAVVEGGSVKIGVLLGFTGPIESLTPDMAAGAEMAMAEA